MPARLAPSYAPPHPLFVCFGPVLRPASTASLRQPLTPDNDAECRRSTALTCTLHQEALPQGAPGANPAVEFTPRIDSVACVPAPCPRLVAPPNAAIPSNPADPVHGVEVRVVCKEGYRAVSTSRNSSTCEDPTFYMMTCLGCKFVSLSRQSRHCAPVACVLPTDLTLARISPFPQNLPVTFGQDIRIECVPGTSIGGMYASAFSTPLYSTVSTCGAECSFSSVSACSLVRCPDVQAPANSVFVISQRGQVFEALFADSSNAFDRIRHNQTISVKCDLGYMAQRAAGISRPYSRGANGSCATSFDLHCQHRSALQVWPPDVHTSEWVDNNMACMPIACGCGFGIACAQYVEDDNAEPSEQTKDGATHGRTIAVTCKSGYGAIPSSVSSSTLPTAAATCSSPRSYTARCQDCSYDRAQRCAPVACSVSVPNAAVRRSDGAAQVGSTQELVITYGESAIASCNEGFRPAQYRALEHSVRQSMSRDVEMRCLGNCSMSPAVVCEPITCSWRDLRSLNLNSSDLLGRNYSHGEYVMVECDKGYYLQGSASCSRVYFAQCKDGLFEGLQQCEAITTSSCGCGIGSCPRYARSMSEASWSPQDVIEHGSELKVTCAEGYRAVESAKTVSTCADPLFATVRCTDCSWTRTDVCRPVTCEHAANATQVMPFESLVAGGRADISCAKGFRVGSTQRSADSGFQAICQTDCELKPAPAETCLRVHCAAPHVSNSIVSSIVKHADGVGMVHGDEVLVRCEQGFQVFGEGIADCATEFYVGCDDGRLSNASLECRPMRCGCGAASCDAVNDANARTVAPAGTLHHGQNAFVKCREGHRVASRSNESQVGCASPDHYYVNCSDCLLNSQPINHACRPISCGIWLPMMQHALSEADLISSSGGLPVGYGEAVSLACPSGYRMGTRSVAAQVRPLSVVCSNNCNFSSPATKLPCLRVSCGVYNVSELDGVLGIRYFDPIVRGWENLSGHTQRQMLYGSTFSVTCAPGYMSFDSSAHDGCQERFNVTCSQSGKMTGAQARCIPRACGCGSTASCAPASLPPDMLELVQNGTLPRTAIPFQANHSMMCRPGFRSVAGRPASSSSAAPLLTTCSASTKRDVTATCADCRLNVSRQCARVQCPEYTTQDPNVESWSTTHASIGGLVTFGTEVDVRCKKGYRAATSASCSSSLCTAQAPSSFKVSCGDECVFSDSKQCLPVTCGGTAFLKNADVVPISVAVAARPAYQVSDRLRVTCKPGFRVWPPQDQSAHTCDDKSFDIRCQDDGGWSGSTGNPPHTCIPITCYVAR